MTQPDHLGKYRILREIGRGGFSVVYQAVDSTLGDRPVALKVLHAFLLVDPEFVARFRREAGIAANLSHPNIVHIYEVGELEGALFIAMEYLAGPALDDALKTEGAFPPRRAAGVIAQVAAALDYAHGRDLIHRDVKPGNIILCAGDRAVLTDFGLARATEGSLLTSTGQIMGTPEYMSPEQAEADADTPLDARTDVYSLGVVAYELLTGKPPFTGQRPSAVLYKVVHEPPPPPLQVNPSLPAEVGQTLLKVLHKRREDRYQTAGAFAQALQKVVEAPARAARQREEAAAAQARAEAEQLSQMEQNYQDGLRLIAEQRWAEAIAALEPVVAWGAGYQDAGAKLAVARQRLAEQKQARKATAPPTPPAARPVSKVLPPARPRQKGIPGWAWMLGGLVVLFLCGLILVGGGVWAWLGQPSRGVPVALLGTSTPLPSLVPTPTTQVFTTTPLWPGETSTPAVPKPSSTPTVPPPTVPPSPTSCPPPVIPTFTASPNTIATGGSATLSWGSVSNATSVSIDHGIGGVGASGTRVVSPASTTTYVMTAVGCGGTVTKSVKVVVNPLAWSDWQDLGGVLGSAPAVASWGVNRLDVFVRGSSDHVWEIAWTGSAWSSWVDLGGVTYDAPAACSWGPNRLDVFIRGTDNALWHKTWDGSAWSGWVSLGGVLGSAPAVASWGPNRLDVFMRGTDNRCWHKWWDGSTWSDWESLGGALADAPAVASRGANRLDVFVRGTADHVWTKAWTGSAWTGWEDLGGVTNAAPAACSWGANRLDVFARGPDNRCWHKWWDGSTWSSLEDLDGACTSGPGAASWGSNRIDVFVRGPLNRLFHKWR